MSLNWLHRVCVLCGVLVAAASAPAADSALWRGLEVRAEAIPGKTWFNGIALEAVQFMGPDVEVLVQRWLDLHRGETLQHADAAGWRVHSLLDGTRSEVLQVRESAGAEVAIWSAMPLGGAMPAMRPSLWSPPAGCRPGPEVEGTEGGQRFRQRTAICRRTPGAVLDGARLDAMRSGLMVKRQWVQGFEAVGMKPPTQLLVMVIATADSTQFVTLERLLPGGQQ
ncbi:MAG: hypothetical protein QM696_03730 [Steroidobacteraceae bacterium]